MIHKVYLSMSNFVSTMFLNTTFQVSSPIVKPSFSIIPAQNISSFTYLYPYQLKFTISMSSGSNVRIFINTDSQQQSTLTVSIIDIQTNGTWSSNNLVVNNVYTINYSYSNPGDYVLFANVSNAVSSFTFTQAIRVRSKVDWLIPLLTSGNSLALFDWSYGSCLVQYVFAFVGFSKAGSHSSVTFWPGDALNASYGPFSLTMDFNANMSKTQLQYTYTGIGNYTTLFWVTNPLGSKYFYLSVRCVAGMGQLAIDVSPYVTQINSSVNVSAYLTQGTNVQYEWLINGVVWQSGSRLGEILYMEFIF
jgi:hypothetical protein